VIAVELRYKNVNRVTFNDAALSTNHFQ
jgi:hypothetical protein